MSDAPLTVMPLSSTMSPLVVRRVTGPLAVMPSMPPAVPTARVWALARDSAPETLLAATVPMRLALSRVTDWAPVIASVPTRTAVLAAWVRLPVLPTARLAAVTEPRARSPLALRVAFMPTAVAATLPLNWLPALPRLRAPAPLTAEPALAALCWTIRLIAPRSSAPDWLMPVMPDEPESLKVPLVVIFSRPPMLLLSLSTMALPPATAEMVLPPASDTTCRPLASLAAATLAVEVVTPLKAEACRVVPLMLRVITPNRRISLPDTAAEPPPMRFFDELPELNWPAPTRSKLPPTCRKASSAGGVPAFWVTAPVLSRVKAPAIRESSSTVPAAWTFLTATSAAS